MAKMDNISKYAVTDVSMIKGFAEPKIPIPEGVPTFKMEDYAELRDIGLGGTGQVWKVKNKSSGELYAIKKVYVFSDEMTGADSKWLERAQHDMKLATSIDHPNVMRCLGVCTNHSSAGIYFLYNYMPIHCAGVSGVKDEHILAGVAYQVLQGLDYLRKEKRFVFKHLTRGNILFDPVSNLVKITDVGILKDRYITLKHVNTRPASMEYIEPENYHKGNDRVCLQSGSLYRKSDVWSLGRCLLKLYDLDEPLASLLAGGGSWIYLLAGLSTRVVVEDESWPPKAPTDAPPLFSDFISSCLTLDVSKRADVDDLLTHPFLVSNGFHHPLGDGKTQGQET